MSFHKILIISNTRRLHDITLGEKRIEADLFKYIGTVIEETGKLDKEVNKKMKRS